MPAPLYTPQLQKLICERVAKGEKPHVAAQVCGISESTHYGWLQRGRQGDAPYFSYLEAVKKAEAVAEARWIEAVQSAAVEGHEVVKEKTVTRPNGSVERTVETHRKRHWQAAAWLLERTREGYDRTANLEDAIKVVADAVLSGDDKAARRLREALGASSSGT